MRDTLKQLIRYLHLGTLLRRLRFGGYWLLDRGGDAIFALRQGMGPHKKQPRLSSGFKKILLIRIDRIGDLVLTTPALRAVRAAFPQSQVDVLVSAYAADIILGNPHVSRVLIHGRKRIDRSYELAIAFHPGWQPNRLAFASGAAVRVGFSGQGGSFWLTHRIPDDRDMRIRHEVDFALQALRPLGIQSADRRLEITVTDEGEWFAEKFWQQHQLKDRVVFLQPGARQPYVRWRQDGFAAVCRRLIQEHRITIIVGADRTEKDMVDSLRQQVGPGMIPCVGERLTHSISVMRRCAFYLGNVTGPMHIASALNLPIVAITGMQGSRDDIRYWAPLSGNVIMVRHDMPCGKCRPGDCPDVHCLRGITDEEVYAAAVSMLKKL